MFKKNIRIALLLLFIIPCDLLILNSKFNLIDVDHLKVIGNNWLYNWNIMPNKLSNLRKIECLDIIKFSYKKDDEYIPLIWSQHKNMDNYILILKENNEYINLIAILENPHNNYKMSQIDDLVHDLVVISQKSNKELILNDLKNWSHGMYLYSYIIEKN